MAYSVQFSGASDQEGKAETFFLCSVGAWGQFRKWVESLPAEDVSDLRTFVDDGEFVGTNTIATQLQNAIDSHLPDEPIAATGEALLEVIGEGAADETIVVTDNPDVPDIESEDEPELEPVAVESVSVPAPSDDELYAEYAAKIREALK